jgi:glycosyltransferase involved in cell wall biosynthesis
MKPFISIIITSHFRARELSRALDSVVSQQFRDFEIVLCTDEGSIDTKKTATEKLRETDIFISIPGIKGPAELRNIGMQVARGKWICFLDDDDSINSDYFLNCAAYLSDPSNLYYFNYHNIFGFNEQTNIAQRIEAVDNSFLQSDYLYIGNYIPIGSFFIDKLVARQHLFDTYLASHEDWDWMLSLKMREQIQFLHREAFGLNIFNSENATRNTTTESKLMHKSDYAYIFKKWPSNINEIEIRRDSIINSWK